MEGEDLTFAEFAEEVPTAESMEGIAAENDAVSADDASSPPTAVNNPFKKQELDKETVKLFTEIARTLGYFVPHTLLDKDKLLAEGKQLCIPNKHKALSGMVKRSPMTSGVAVYWSEPLLCPTNVFVFRFQRQSGKYCPWARIERVTVDINRVSVFLHVRYLSLKVDVGVDTETLLNDVTKGDIIQMTLTDLSDKWSDEIQHWCSLSSSRLVHPDRIDPAKIEAWPEMKWDCKQLPNGPGTTPTPEKPPFVPVSAFKSSFTETLVTGTSRLQENLRKLGEDEFVKMKRAHDALLAKKMQEMAVAQEMDVGEDEEL